MATDGKNPPHLVSLKVMRISRPSIASGWEPFYSSSPSFSAHSTASIMSLQGKAPLSGNPKTLRDLTHLSELLVLPPSFGSIQLGETFTSCICVNNESQIDLESVHLRVEVQTSTTKVLIAQCGGLQSPLSARDSLECIADHEIKELGQHVLICAVTYKPPEDLAATLPEPDKQDPSLQTFRKYYKFPAANPLSVKTKVHSVRSPSAVQSLQEREKIFLEVQIQNLTPNPLWFEDIHLECLDEWQASDVNTALYQDSNALLQPQDIRQYVYILLPTHIDLAPPVHAPGTVIPLGRLNIAWRSSFGEPGHLLTSTLSRRIHAPPPAQSPASALPPHLKRPQAIRPQSPQPPASPPPYRTRTPSTSVSLSRPQTPTTFVTPKAPPVAPVEVYLTVKHISRSTVCLDTPFPITFTLTVRTTTQTVKPGFRRSVILAVQHVQSQHSAMAANPSSSTPHLPASTAGTSSGFSTPRSPEGPTSPGIFDLGLAHQKLLSTSLTERDNIPTPRGETLSYNGQVVILPPPFPQGPEAEARFHKMSGASFCGQSAIVLSPFDFTSPKEGAEAVDPSAQAASLLCSHDFTLRWTPLRKGLTPIGGLRVLLLDDQMHAIGQQRDASEGDGLSGLLTGRTLKEWDIVAEVWVSC